MKPRNSKRQRRTMRQELALYVSGLALITAIAFIVALEAFFIRGLDEAVGTSLLMEARTYDAKYQKDPTTPPSNSSWIRSFFDDFSTAPALYQELIRQDELKPGEFAEYAWEPFGEHEWQDSRYLIVYRHILPDNRDLFLVADYQANLLTAEEKSAFDRTLDLTLYFGGSYLLLMLLTIWLYNRRINHYTQKLANWAESLTLERIRLPDPDFRFDELNSIAEQLLAAFERIAGLLEREHQFLRHASHELRTPITIIRANMELLQRVGVPTQLARPVERVDRANQSMQQLTETLLWLSRENDTLPSVTAVQPARLLDEISEELEYLLQNKEVELLRIYSEPVTAQQLPLTPLRIVLANLLRNAYQYTEQGKISLTVTNDSIVISNQSEYATGDSDSSFGLGLMLVQKICDRLGWQLSLEWLSYGVKAELILPVQPTPAEPASESH
ncbi:MAG: HAMP domain-containing histidine kinase [Amphritea sp.]|nr:HAMP domain-containing histidine kinase [Amphritea sp.]